MSYEKSFLNILTRQSFVFFKLRLRARLAAFSCGEYDSSYITMCIMRLHINMTISFKCVCSGHHNISAHTQPEGVCLHVTFTHTGPYMVYTWSGLHPYTVQQINKKMNIYPTCPSTEWYDAYDQRTWRHVEALQSSGGSDRPLMCLAHLRKSCIKRAKPRPVYLKIIFLKAASLEVIRRSISIPGGSEVIQHLVEMLLCNHLEVHLWGSSSVCSNIMCSPGLGRF